jgi:hypothetical protein
MSPKISAVLGPSCRLLRKSTKSEIPYLAGPEPNRAEVTAKYAENAESPQEQVFFPCIPRIPRFTY